jgi:large subunit ribosomal protein L6
VSRIGKTPVAIPGGVKIEVKGNLIKVTGPKGTLEQDFQPEVSVKVNDSEVVVTRSSDRPDVRALHGLTRALINNMVVGVTQGYERILEIHGVGYRASLQGKSLKLQLGHSHPVVMDAPEGIEYAVDGNTTIRVTGIDKQQVGQTAAQIRKWRKPEPYKGKGVRYRDEYVRRKAGKAGA